MEEENIEPPKQVRIPKDPFTEQFQPLENDRLFSVVDATLKRPAQMAHELIHGTGWKAPLFLTLVLLFCLTVLGIIMGSFSGGAQFWAVPLKIVTGTVISALICMPSLYILLCLSGGGQSFPQVGRMLLLGLTLAGILFIGFVPVAWIFSQATESAVFMGVLYLLVWGIGLFFGLRLMKTALEFLNKRSLGTLNLWMFIFAMVLLQMSTTLRPIIGKSEPLKFNEKMFFMAHWSEALR
ncbi:hypothetical protein P4C99_12900 [Pontiellaceae bacterium B1224]|nr:hypothetical protein [Pontiellaceae bacterium B1224]